MKDLGYIPEELDRVAKLIIKYRNLNVLPPGMCEHIYDLYVSLHVEEEKIKDRKDHLLQFLDTCCDHSSNIEAVCKAEDERVNLINRLNKVVQNKL